MEIEKRNDSTNDKQRKGEKNSGWFGSQGKNIGEPKAATRILLESTILRNSELESVCSRLLRNFKGQLKESLKC
jgi:hypothetical protein